MLLAKLKEVNKMMIEEELNICVQLFIEIKLGFCYCYKKKQQQYFVIFKINFTARVCG